MSRFSAEDKIIAVKRYLDTHESISQIAASMNLDRETLRMWINNYESFGPDIFYQNVNKKYSLEEKTKAVEYYLSGKGSLFDTCKVFKIRSKIQLQQWISLYNDHRLKATPGGNSTMVRRKGRKTTLEERISIVEDHIRSNMSYAETAEKYDLSYQQVYQWIQKYNEQGIDGLKDKRGRTKPTEEMTELEKLKAENRMLKAELERKELENLFLKKLDEIERRRS